MSTHEVGASTVEAYFSCEFVEVVEECRSMRR